MNDFVVLVVGVTADGKSTLLNALMEGLGCECEDERPVMMDQGNVNAKGTTTETQFFNTNQMIGSCRLVLVDTPGFGTQTVPIEHTIASIIGEFDRGVKINCIVVTAPATTVNPGVGAQIVRSLVQRGIAGDDESAWNNVVLVGTKADRAEASEMRRFKMAVVPEFFREAPHGCRQHFCFTRALEKDNDGNASKLDVSELLELLKQLDSTFFYKQHGLTDDVLAKIFTDQIGMTADKAKKTLDEVDRLRQEIRKKEEEIKNHIPGKQHIETEKSHLEDLLKKEQIEKKDQDEYKLRHEFLKKRGAKAKRCIQEEATEAKIANQPGEDGNVPIGQTFKYACPPKGTVADILWHLYLHRFKEKVDYPDEFEVDRVENERVNSRGEYEYYLKWKGYPPDRNTWELEKDIIDKSLLANFRKAQKAQAGTPPSKRQPATSGTSRAAKAHRKGVGSSNGAGTSSQTAQGMGGPGDYKRKANAKAPARDPQPSKRPVRASRAKQTVCDYSSDEES